jgi:hypothetical protein
MKITFANIINPITEPSSHVITGYLPTGELVQVSRHLNHWDVNLKIVVDGFVWHDDKPTPAEMHEFNILRESALNDVCNKRDEARAKANRIASFAFVKA